MPAAAVTPPTIGLSTTVCGLDTSILKNPTSATRSVVKYVKVGTARAATPRTSRINPITTSSCNFMTGLLEDKGLRIPQPPSTLVPLDTAHEEQNEEDDQN